MFAISFRIRDAATFKRLRAIARRSTGLPVDARSPRPTPPTGLLSFETMREMVAKAEGGRS
jgi:hypothetical protein